MPKGIQPDEDITVELREPIAIVPGFQITTVRVPTDEEIGFDKTFTIGPMADKTFLTVNMPENAKSGDSIVITIPDIIKPCEK